MREIKDFRGVFKSSPALSSRRAGLAGLLLLPALFAGSVLPGNAQTLQATNPAVVANKSTPNLVSYADLVERVSPAVVTVRSERKSTASSQSQQQIPEELREFFGRQFPQMQQAPRVQRGIGSGVIIESNGTILTNNHVVEGASQVKVEFTDRRTFTARVVGTDPASDLAVLKIDATNLPTLPLGNSDQVRVGDAVIAVGNPLGLRQTVTSGIISAKGRSTGVADGSFEDFLQTDASINQGNSGGALVNTNGELIGINSQILSPSGGSIGIGFAIPSNMAKSVMSQLVTNGRVRRGQLGVGIQEVTAALAENFGLKDVRGVIVNSVTPGGAAERANIRQGDVILSLNGTAVNDVNDLRNRVAQTAPNSTINVGVLRGGQQQTVPVTLGELQAKKEADEKETTAPTAEPTTGKLGLTLQPVTPQLAQQLEIKNAASGLVVRSVQPGSPADDAGIAQGDVIMEVNRQAVRTTQELNAAMAKKAGSSVLFLVNRGGQTLFISVQA